MNCQSEGTFEFFKVTFIELEKFDKILWQKYSLRCIVPYKCKELQTYFMNSDVNPSF